MSLLRRIQEKWELCSYCKYYRDSRDYAPSCEVFLHFNKPLPKEIYQRKFDHRYPHPEDGGIQFEAASMEELQQRRPFKNSTHEEIETFFQRALAELESRHKSNEVPTNEGHLPSIWWLYDE